MEEITSSEDFDRKRLGQKIKEIRKAKKITSDTLSEMIGKNSGAYIRSIESGSGGVSVKALLDIANALQISLDYFLSDYYTFQPEQKYDEPISLIYHDLSQRDKQAVLQLAEYLRDSSY